MCTQSVLLASHDYSVSEYAHVPNNFYKSGVPVLLHHYFWGRGLKTLGTPGLEGRSTGCSHGDGKKKTGPDLKVG